MCNRVSPLSLLLVILDRNGVIRLLNDLFAEQVVKGRVHRILTRAEMLGYMILTCLRVHECEVNKQAVFSEPLTMMYINGCHIHFESLLQHCLSHLQLPHQYP